MKPKHVHIIVLCLQMAFVPALLALDTGFRFATFSADVTPPIGHPLMGGGIKPAGKVVDPLFAKGWVLTSQLEKPIVFVSVDWCEIRNQAYDRWREVLGKAAGTDAGRVFVTSVHVHDAPVADLEAQRILEAHHAAGNICDLRFHEEAVQRVAHALTESLKTSRRVTQFGLGQAKVEKVASNRRYTLDDGTVRYGRYSATKDPLAQAAEEGTIDPWLKTLSFWDGGVPLAAMHFYAVHPMSYYGGGGVSADFVGMARARMQAENPSVFQIYVSGCSGNVTAGKFNDGSPGNRPILADRIYAAMKASWSATKRQKLVQCKFEQASLVLEPRNEPGFSAAELEEQLGDHSKPFRQCLAAMGLSWRARHVAAPEIDVPMLDFGGAQIVLLPAESYVEFQLFAQQQRPNTFVLTAGYGECAPGYIPIERAWAEHDSNLTDWCWINPGSQRKMEKVIESLFRKH
ncbi:MAG: hypothetical protein ABIQ35_09960 [Verrucomicrobiota bacterium]